MRQFEKTIEGELSGYVSGYLHYETLTLKTLLQSITMTDSPKALELRNKDRLALIYSQNGRIVHAVESHFSLNSDALLGREALRAIAQYESVNFREFHCDIIEQTTLDLRTEEVFDTNFMGGELSIEAVIELTQSHPTIELGLLLRKNNTHNIFYAKSPDNYQMLSQTLLNYSRDLLNLMHQTHMGRVDNIQLSLSDNKFKKVLIKQFGKDNILLFFKSSHIAKELLISFDDMI